MKIQFSKGIKRALYILCGVMVLLGIFVMEAYMIIRYNVSPLTYLLN
jgi:hypothetical protein